MKSQRQFSVFLVLGSLMMIGSPAVLAQTGGVHLGLTDEDVPFTEITGIYSDEEVYLYGKDDNASSAAVVFGKHNTVRRQEIVDERELKYGSAYQQAVVNNGDLGLAHQLVRVGSFTEDMVKDARTGPCSGTNNNVVSLNCALSCTVAQQSEGMCIPTAINLNSLN